MPHLIADGAPYFECGLEESFGQGRKGNSTALSTKYKRF